MPITGNKGEWSEIYTLFKLLGDGKVHAGDADLNKLDLYYPIINIIRQEMELINYKPNLRKHVEVVTDEGVRIARIPMKRFVQESQELLENIKEAKDRSFSLEDTESFMNEIGATKLKAPSSDKADIQIVIHDLRTGMKPQLGFSIKSQLGSASTLLNAGKPTNILYKVKGVDFSDDDIKRINEIEDHLPRMQAIADMGGHLEYADIEKRTFKNNLLFIDTYLPNFIADCLVVSSFTDGINDIKAVVEHLSTCNPFKYEGNNVLQFYEHKMKQLLLSVALGMTPATEWQGRYDANGGYLVVRKDGEIVCYHFYNRNDVEDYLYANTRFDRPSRERYDFGSLFRDGEDVYLRLNIQIRFKK